MLFISSNYNKAFAGQKHNVIMTSITKPAPICMGIPVMQT